MGTEKITHYDFRMLGHCMSARTKVQKHVRANNVERCKDYVVKCYDTWSPKDVKGHPIWEDIASAIRVLNRANWTVYTGVWKDQGVQVIVKDPAGNCYRSHYNHGGA